jgi:hypothetical protein
MQALWYSPVLGKISADVPDGPRGGLLCEEMGLGKTVEILALVLANPAPPSIVSSASVKTHLGSFIQSRGTLVICKVCRWPPSPSLALLSRHQVLCLKKGLVLFC